MTAQTQRKTAVLICPGRGTYTKSELGSLKRHFHDAALLAKWAQVRSVRDAVNKDIESGCERLLCKRWVL